MNILPIILKKKTGQKLAPAEFNQIVNGYIQNKISDAQMASFLMVLCFRKLSDQEILDFFDAIYQTSFKIDFKTITGFKLDKHATGGIGDKGTLVLIPFLQYFDIKMFKYSGRRLGFTGGTIDKLSSISAMKVDFTLERLKLLAKKINIIVANTNHQISPFESKTYPLRSQTGSLDAIGLIVISVLIKKLLLKNDGLLIDLKVGSGAFFKTMKQADEFARLAKLIAHNYQRPIRFVFSDMDQLTGSYIGNKLEVWNVLQFFEKPKQFPRLQTFTNALVANALVLVRNISLQKAFQLINQAWKKRDQLLLNFKQFIQGQNGRFNDIKLRATKTKIAVLAMKNGYWSFQNLQKLGSLFNRLSINPKQTIDFDAGIQVHCSAGAYVRVGEKIMTLYTNFTDLDAESLIREARQTFQIKTTRPDLKPVILKVI